MLRARILSFLNFNLNISWNFFEGKLSSLSKCSFEGWCCCCGCCKWAIFMNFTRYIKQTDKLDGIGYILRSKKFFFLLNGVKAVIWWLPEVFFYKKKVICSPCINLHPQYIMKVINLTFSSHLMVMWERPHFDWVDRHFIAVFAFCMMSNKIL